ncbi:adenylylsulfate reductase thioredoxin dependent [Candidatus Omnitrophus magneticus]|uniref:Adenosine 5'-phosphosulfate reductase n=1 Tax=Candidatus Omnitrophus magneticus TaxID=1609969 RepID=A0A0F0CLM6_9BACT|nr:adenylylsulfate reductase thioredoxin dependent [Candidatus Omnitrophus magneticus]
MNSREKQNMELFSYIENLDNRKLEEIILKLAQVFGSEKIVFASSLSIEDQVITDIIAKKINNIKIFTLDTGMLPKETIELIDITEKKYNIKIERVMPDETAVLEMIRIHGANLYYESVEKRKLCCHTRKILPLLKRLAVVNVWITGLRREQSITREHAGKIEFDEKFGIIKVNPLMYWTTQDVWKYIGENNVPYNVLYDRGYQSVGCASCSRAVKPGEDLRSGRWWWEDPSRKECGLHINPKNETKARKNESA